MLFIQHAMLCVGLSDQCVCLEYWLLQVNFELVQDELELET